MLCARKINDEMNFMKGIETNSMFIGVLLAIAGLQVFIMFSGGINKQIAYAFSVHIYGLTSIQWAITVLGGLITFPINFVLKKCPDTWAPILGEEPSEDLEAAAKDYSDLQEYARNNKLKKVRDHSGQQFVRNKEGGSFKGK